MNSQSSKRGMLRPNHGSSRSPIYLLLGLVAVIAIAGYYYHSTSEMKKLQEDRNNLVDQKLNRCLLEKTELNTKNEAMRNNEEELERKAKEAVERVETLQAQLNDRETKTKALEEQLGSVKEDLNQAKTSLDTCQASSVQSKEQIERLNAQIEQLKNQQEKQQEEKHIVTSEKESIPQQNHQTESSNRDILPVVPGDPIDQVPRNVPAFRSRIPIGNGSTPTHQREEPVKVLQSARGDSKVENEDQKEAGSENQDTWNGSRRQINRAPTTTLFPLKSTIHRQRFAGGVNMRDNIGEVKDTEEETEKPNPSLDEERGRNSDPPSPRNYRDPDDSIPHRGAGKSRIPPGAFNGEAGAKTESDLKLNRSEEGKNYSDFDGNVPNNQQRQRIDDAKSHLIDDGGNQLRPPQKLRLPNDANTGEEKKEEERR